MEFPFYDTPNTATITFRHIIEAGCPILYVAHDEDDGMWQFLCGKTHETKGADAICNRFEEIARLLTASLLRS